MSLASKKIKDVVQWPTLGVGGVSGEIPEPDLRLTYIEYDE